MMAGLMDQGPDNGSPPVDPAEKRRQNRQKVRAGCGTGLGCLTVVLIPILGSVALERFLHAATLNPITADLMVVYPPERHAWILACTLPVTLIIPCAAMATKTCLLPIAQPPPLLPTVP